MAFIVNSAPSAGLLFEPGVTVAEPAAALAHAVALSRRGMRQIKIRDIESGEIYDERGFRQYMERLKTANSNEPTK